MFGENKIEFDVCHCQLIITGSHVIEVHAHNEYL